MRRRPGVGSARVDRLRTRVRAVGSPSFSAASQRAVEVGEPGVEAVREVVVGEVPDVAERGDRLLGAIGASLCFPWPSDSSGRLGTSAPTMRTSGASAGVWSAISEVDLLRDPVDVVDALMAMRVGLHLAGQDPCARLCQASSRERARLKTPV